MCAFPQVNASLKSISDFFQKKIYKKKYQPQTYCLISKAKAFWVCNYWCWWILYVIKSIMSSRTSLCSLWSLHNWFEEITVNVNFWRTEWRSAEQLHCDVLFSCHSDLSLSAYIFHSDYAFVLSHSLSERQYSIIGTTVNAWNIAKALECSQVQ